jgi:NAD(P)-dependent dehydrogenase (short-subunit alcohol dehydrogenase family)
LELQDRVALVAGGAGGLGSAVVRHLRDQGMRVVVFDWAGDRARELAEELGEGVQAVAGDAADDEAVGRAIGAARRLGPLRLVVNAGGGGVPAGRTVGRDGAPHSREAFERTLEMNAVAMFNLCRLAAAALTGSEPEDGGERAVFVNTASIAGLEGQAGQVAYAAAKAAILGMTLPMARDLAPLGIRVCAIAPGTMGTPVMLSAPDPIRARLVENIMFPKRMGRPEEFALLVEAIARNPYLNGENIRLDGALRFPPK